MPVERAFCIDDLRIMARKRMPKLMFDFIEGGVEGEHALARNGEAFRKHQLLPRYLVDVSRCTQAKTILGATYDSPFGISPTGLAGMFWPNADLCLAKAAAEANIPYIMSAGSNATLEQAVSVAGKNTWFQLYAARESQITEDLIRRARDLGTDVLVHTVDVPTASKRERNLRNGFTRPIKITPRVILDVLRHPAWLMAFWRHGGTPVMGNIAPYARPGASADEVADVYVRNMPAANLTWRDVEAFRRLWPGKFVLKGVMHPADAARALDCGVDGIIVSNHGGRQLDAAPSPLEVLPMIRAAVGSRAAVMFDSGISRGSDIVIALCLGAEFVFTGRATLYGAAAGGLEGVRRAIGILRKEVGLALGQIGCPRIDDLGPGNLLATSRAGSGAMPSGAEGGDAPGLEICRRA